MDEKQASQMTTGLVVVLVGLVLLAGQFRVGLDLSRLWPLILIVLGVGRFLSTDKNGRRGNGGWLLFLGGLFLLHTFHIWTIRQSWPLLVVAGGVAMMFKRDRTPPPAPGAPGAGESGSIDRFRDGRFQP
jgi:lia operon protein LiaF